MWSPRQTGSTIPLSNVIPVKWGYGVIQKLPHEGLLAEAAIAFITAQGIAVLPNTQVTWPIAEPGYRNVECRTPCDVSGIPAAAPHDYTGKVRSPASLTFTKTRTQRAHPCSSAAIHGRSGAPRRSSSCPRAPAPGLREVGLSDNSPWLSSEPSVWICG